MRSYTFALIFTLTEATRASAGMLFMYSAMNCKDFDLKKKKLYFNFNLFALSRIVIFSVHYIVLDSLVALRNTVHG